VVQRTYDEDADGDVDRTYTYSFTENGLPLVETEDDADYSAVTTYEYDSEDRLVRQILTQYLPSMFVIEDTYEYDDTGLLTTVETDWNEDGDAEEVWRATYDSDGRVIRSEVRDGSGELQSAFELEYEHGQESVRTSHDHDGDGDWDSVTVSTRTACD
jgi:YD repeat-containing protein